MNAFEQFDTERTQRRLNIIPAWNQFRVAVKDSVQSYNDIEEGKKFPAEVEDAPNQNRIIVKCNRGVASARFKTLIVIATMKLVQERIAIAAEIQSWETQQIDSKAVPPPPQVEGLEFLIEADANPHICLSQNGEFLTPAEAADKVLLKALLGRSSNQKLSIVA